MCFHTFFIITKHRKIQIMPVPICQVSAGIGSFENNNERLYKQELHWFMIKNIDKKISTV